MTVREQGGAIDADATEGHGSTPVALYHVTLKTEISVSIVIRVGHQDQVSETVGRTMEVRKIDIAPHVAVDHQERPGAEEREGIEDTPTGLQGRIALLRVGDVEAVSTAVPYGPANLIAEPPQVDDDALQSRTRDGAEMPPDQGQSANLEQGLRHVIGQRSHALATSRSQNHGRCGAVPRTGALFRLLPVRPTDQRILPPRSGLRRDAH